MECSSKLVCKTDSCTNCYSKICDTCQIRQDFVFDEMSSRTHRSELFVDEIYTCNKCDQAWMDLFHYCFSCNRLVCKSFYDKHDECPKIYGLMKSDIIKRRRLGETEDEMRNLDSTLSKNKHDINEICERLENSNFLTTLKKSAADIISKIEEIVQTHIYDSNMFKTQLSSAHSYLNQQTDSIQLLKTKMEHMKKNVPFPVTFLLEIAEFDKTFKRMIQNHSKFDISPFLCSNLTSIKCQPMELDRLQLCKLLGIQWTNSHQDAISITDTTSVGQPPNNVVASGISCNCQQKENEVKKQSRSKTLPHVKPNGSESPWYKISVLEKNLKEKDEYIQKLRSSFATAKTKLDLLRCSRDAAKHRMVVVEKELQERIQQLESEAKRRNEQHKNEIEALTNSKLHLEVQLQDIKTTMESQMNRMKSEQEDLNTRHGKVIASLASETEMLRQEVQQKEDARKLVENDMDTFRKQAEDAISRYQSNIQKNLEFSKLQCLQIEGLQDHIRLLEKEKCEGFSNNSRYNDEEKENIKEVLRRVTRMFKEWTKSTTSLNNMMAHELNQVNITEQLDSAPIFENVTECNDHQRCSRDENVDSYYMQEAEEVSQTTATFNSSISSENSNKNITSVTYNAKQIHVIQYSQVSLADSGCDTKSFFEDQETVLPNGESLD